MLQKYHEQQYSLACRNGMCGNFVRVGKSGCAKRYVSAGSYDRAMRSPLENIFNFHKQSLNVKAD